MFAYRPPIEGNKPTFLMKFNKPVNRYNNILAKVDLSIDFPGSTMDTNNYLCDFIDTFSLTYIVNSETSFKTLN